MNHIEVPGLRDNDNFSKSKSRENSVERNEKTPIYQKKTISSHNKMREAAAAGNARHKTMNEDLGQVKKMKDAISTSSNERFSVGASKVSADQRMRFRRKQSFDDEINPQHIMVSRHNTRNDNK